MVGSMYTCLVTQHFKKRQTNSTDGTQKTRIFFFLTNEEIGFKSQNVEGKGNTGNLPMANYIPALCCDFTKRVARSMHTIKQPVTLGSRVPLCPVFSTRSIRRIQATTSWEEGLEGLSRLMNPVLEWKRNYWALVLVP